MSDNKSTVSYEDAFEPILPDGWAGDEGADIFDPSTWGDAGDADAHDGGSDEVGEEHLGDDGDTPATGEDDGETGDDETNAPATGEEEAPSGKLRFRVSIDHQSRDVEIDPSELPDLYERASALDRYKKRMTDMENERHTIDAELSDWDAIASNLQYEDRHALRKGVVENAVQNYIASHPGVPEDMARDYVTRQFNEKKAKPQEAERAPQEKPAGRDFKAEVAELYSMFPSARSEQLPDEVTDAVIKDGKPLVVAYAAYVAKREKAEAKVTKKENKILKQNQASAAKGPVSKVSGGGKTDTSPEDDFLRGFNSDEW